MSNIAHVVPANPNFDLEALIIESLALQDREELTEGFSLSPLTSPESTPPSSPVNLPVSPSESELTPASILATSSTTSDQSYENSTASPNKRQKKNPDRITPAHRKKRRNAAGNTSRAKKREGKQKPEDAEHVARQAAYKRYAEPAQRIDCHLNMAEANIAEGAHIAYDDGCGDRKTYMLEDVIGEKAKRKLRLQKWDGETPMALLDDKGRVIGILAGHPDDPNWGNVQQRAAEALESRRSRCYISKAAQKKASRRGNFVALNAGVSHGGGQRRPSNRRNDPPNQEVLDELNSLEPFKRIAGFSNSVMATWMPGLYEYYRTMGDALFEHDPHLIRIFPSSVFPGATYNLGPKTVCYTHKDFGNLSFGVCPVTSFGSYDHTKGGHLILWDLNLVVEFPPGSTILIPSAVVAHCNVAIAPHEHRYSFTQYSAGGLFRWVDNNFQTQIRYRASLSKEERATDQKKQDGRLKFGLSLLPTLSSLTNVSKSSSNS